MVRFERRECDGLCLHDSIRFLRGTSAKTAKEISAEKTKQRRDARRYGLSLYEKSGAGFSSVKYLELG
jgi:hypothetical protein